MTKLKLICALLVAALYLIGQASVAAAAIHATDAVPAHSARPVTDTSSCKLVLDANSKTLNTPNHSYMDGLGTEGKQRTGEMITINGDRYVMVSGKWNKSRMTVAATKAQEEENIKNAKVLSCKRIGDDIVGGEAATVYTEHTENEDTKSDGKIWVSKSRGILLKEEIDLDSGDATKQHITIRYEYGNVKAPI